MSNENTIVTKTYYSLRAVLLRVAPLCKNSMTNPSMHLRVFLDDSAGPRLEVYFTRPGYSSVGYHEGTESCTVTIPLLERDKIAGGTGGIFDDMDHWLIDLDAANVTSMEHPAAYRANADADNDMCGEGYFPPDEDFWWEEFQREFEHYVRNTALPNYEFSTLDGEGNKGRFWRITGDDDEFVWNLDDMTPQGSIWPVWDDAQLNDLDGYEA